VLKTVATTMLLSLTLVATPLSMTARAQTKSPNFPIVIAKSERLADAGIKVAWNSGPDFKHYANRCYHYGEGGLSLSVSDELLARYKAKGFSLNSLCMGLVSEVRFDPETGKRLPTYMLVDAVALKAATKGRDVRKLTAKQLEACCSEPGLMTEELPLIVPACFKNGTPYSDCDWRYGIKTGVKVRDETRQNFARLGREIERIMGLAIREKLVCISEMGAACIAERYDEIPRANGEQNVYGNALAPESYAMSPILDGQTRADLRTGENLIKLSKAMFVDISKTFPKGFGYALFADGAAGPSVSAAVIKVALGDGEPETQISTARLQALMGDD
jgi:hypothetical protein